MKNKITKGKKMSNYGGYPDGAKYDPRAPWNNPDNKPKWVSVEALITLKHKCEVVVSNENLKEAYKDCHYSVSELMQMLKVYAEKELEGTVYSPRAKRLQEIISDCEGWEEEEVFVEC